MNRRNEIGRIAMIGCVAMALAWASSAHAAVAALDIAEGYVGTQTFGGELGYTFTVLDPIDITSLGAFDSNADGFVGTITTRLWAGTAFAAGPGADDVFASAGTLLASTTFDNTSGTATGTGTGYVYREIDPVTLAPGVYVVSASGFGATDPNGNSPAISSAVDGNTGSLVRFGAQGFNAGAGSFPSGGDGFWSVDPGRYGAGSFEFEASELRIIDNGDTGYSQTLFSNQVAGEAFNSTQAFNSAANNGGHADWQFTGLADGTYEIFATWDQNGQGNLTTAAPYSFTPLGGTGASTTVDQRSASGPDADLVLSDSNLVGLVRYDFQRVGAVTVKNGQIDVRLDAVPGGTTSDFVFADAVAIKPVEVPTGLVDTVDWDPSTAASVGSTGTVDGVGVQVNSNDILNEGLTFGVSWASVLGSDDALPGGVTFDEAAAIGDGTVSVALTGGTLRNPILTFNFVNDGTFDFTGLDFTLLDSSFAALGGSVVTVAGSPGGGDSGFTIQLHGEYSAFSFEIATGGTSGFTIGVVPAPAALPAGLGMIGLLGMRRRRRNRARKHKA